MSFTHMKEEMMRRRYFSTLLPLLWVAVACQDGSLGRDSEPTPDSLSPEGIQRLTPEQASNRVQAALGFRLGDLPYPDDDEVELELELERYDYIVDEIGVGLGGIDFDTASVRDPTTHASTLLLVHAVAWQAALESIWADFIAIEQGQSPRFFNQARGFDIDTGDQPDWDNQLDHIYWLILQRPPSGEERTAIAEMFRTETASTSAPLTAWRMVIYTLFASMEFWTR